MSIYLGSNLRYLRKKNAVNQSDIASLLNKGATTIGNWENGISEPNIIELNTLTGYFEVSLDDLINTDMHQNGAGSDHVSEARGTYGKIPRTIISLNPDKDNRDAIIKAQKITIETLQRALKLAEEQIKLLKKSPF